ncbi:MAG: hypothetical protein WB952_01010 [Terriglobales bacterium]
MRKLQQIAVLMAACILTGAAGAQVTGSGTANSIPIWTGTTVLGDSNLSQASNGNVGIGISKPSTKLDVKGSAKIRGNFKLPAMGTANATSGFASYPFDEVGSSFNGGMGVDVNQTFRWQVLPLGSNTPSPSGELSLAYGSGSNTPVPTGLTVLSNGLIHFVPGQPFPGTVTSIGSGLGLLGGPITSSGTLAIDTTVVPQLGTSNTFTGNQTVNGNVSVVGGTISVGGSRALSCTRSCKAIGSIPNGGTSLYSTGAVAAPAGYSLTGCSAFWASSSSCGVIQYPTTANITALDDGAGACHALGYNGGGSTLESCACVTACELP